MIALTHPVTGHQINVDDESADFWQAAGYRAEVKATKRAAVKKAAPRKNSK